MTLPLSHLDEPLWCLYQPRGYLLVIFQYLAPLVPCLLYRTLAADIPIIHTLPCRTTTYSRAFEHVQRVHILYTSQALLH